MLSKCVVEGLDALLVRSGKSMKGRCQIATCMDKYETCDASYCTNAGETLLAHGPQAIPSPVRTERKLERLLPCIGNTWLICSKHHTARHGRTTQQINLTNGSGIKESLLSLLVVRAIRMQSE